MNNILALKKSMEELMNDLYKYDSGDITVPFAVIRADLAELAIRIERAIDELMQISREEES